MTRYEELEITLEALVNMYVANKGSKNEFISCITPEKRTSHCWLLWTKAMDVLKRDKEKQNEPTKIRN